jgi:hypothetical protein
MQVKRCACGRCVTSQAKVTTHGLPLNSLLSSPSCIRNSTIIIPEGRLGSLQTGERTCRARGRAWRNWGPVVCQQVVVGTRGFVSSQWAAHADLGGSDGVHILELQQRIPLGLAVRLFLEEAEEPHGAKLSRRGFDLRVRGPPAQVADVQRRLRRVACWSHRRPGPRHTRVERRHPPNPTAAGVQPKAQPVM